METPPTLDQVIAHNLREVREEQGWTQKYAGERLEEYLGEQWTTARWSQVEAAGRGGRERSFSVEELFAFVEMFQVPVARFLKPPPGVHPDLLPPIWLTDQDFGRAEVDYALDVLSKIKGWATDAESVLTDATRRGETDQLNCGEEGHDYTEHLVERPPGVREGGNES